MFDSCLTKNFLILIIDFNVILNHSFVNQYKQFCIVVCSDGIVRIFTQDEGRCVSDDALKTYQEEVNALSKQSQQEIGGVKVSE